MQTPNDKAFDHFDSKLEELEEKEDHLGLIEYLVSLKSVLVSLPVTHKNSPITFQRIILLVLPLIKYVEEDKRQDQKRLRTAIDNLCQIIKESEYQLSIRVNS